MSLSGLATHSRRPSIQQSPSSGSSSDNDETSSVGTADSITDSLSESMADSLSTGVGTPFYRSPEQGVLFSASLLMRSLLRL